MRRKPSLLPHSFPPAPHSSLVVVASVFPEYLERVKFDNIKNTKIKYIDKKLIHLFFFFDPRLRGGLFSESTLTITILFSFRIFYSSTSSADKFKVIL